MARLILLVLAVMAVIAVVATISTTARGMRTTALEADMPKSIQTVSYVLLIVLMLGVVTGWLGGL